MVELEFPYPMQSNHLTTVARGRKIKNPKYRVWMDLAGASVAHQMRTQKPVHGPFHIMIEVDRPDRRKRDVDNLSKGILDCLKMAGVIDDDSLAQSVTMKWATLMTAPKYLGKEAVARVEIEAL